ncbi:MAG: propionate catabolism operon transcriptional regulator, partial [Glaciecola sp.]
GALAKSEHQLVIQAMNKFNGNKELVTQFLGISQTTLWRRLKLIHENKKKGQQHA